MAGSTTRCRSGDNAQFMKRRKIMLKLARKKFFSPHLCPECGKLMIIIPNPCCTRCPKCQRHFLRQTNKDNAFKRSRRKHTKTSYKTAKKRAITNQGYCALCGSIEDLTAHHTCNVETGEWQGQHLTVLCDVCHKIWEQKVNILRKKGIS